MEVLKDLYYTNRRAVKETYKILKKNWPIIFVGILYALLGIGVGAIVLLLSLSIFRLLAGILLTIAVSALVSDYLYLLSKIVRGGKVNLNDVKYGFKAYLWKIYGIFFIGWIASMLFGLFIRPVFLGSYLARVIPTIINVLIIILLNPLPEALYQKHYGSGETIQYAINFVRESWLEWFVPNVIFMAVLYLLVGGRFNGVFSFIFSFSRGISLEGLFLFLVAQILLSFIMVYRGVLFETLSTSTRRKRMFMRDLYK